MNETRLHDDGEETGLPQRAPSGPAAQGVPPVPRVHLVMPAAVHDVRAAHANARPSDTHEGDHRPDEAVDSNLELFDRGYLNALVQEGINLNAFLDGWSQAMRDDLNQLVESRREGDSEHFRHSLHRLSGGLGLVGAHSLIEALRHIRTAPSTHDRASIDTLTARIRTLLEQLEPVRDDHRSARP
ncbi:Hpt domain-containing protein [Burkholderia sp. WSM2230]|uniref:Hpt domain-containing protein n=1 Tax=Burkholderia sp. WSM2230 TaxID=944435 RepID=UPI00046FB715|nr:Hpt domain-containing protein [Burkholderia sp. WSM2230]